MWPNVFSQLRGMSINECSVVRSVFHSNSSPGPVFGGQVNFFPGNLSIVKLTKFVKEKGDEPMLRFWFRVNSRGYVSREFGMVIAV